MYCWVHSCGKQTRVGSCWVCFFKQLTGIALGFVSFCSLKYWLGRLVWEGGGLAERGGLLGVTVWGCCLHASAH